MPENSPAFVDSNIWLYALIESENGERKSQVARALIKDSIAVIGIQVINEVCINLIRKAQFNEDQITELIESFYQSHPVVEMGKTVLLRASKLRNRHSFSYWDSLIAASALVAEAEALYSEDMQDGLEIEGKLKVMNPFKT